MGSCGLFCRQQSVRSNFTKRAVDIYVVLRQVLCSSYCTATSTLKDEQERKQRGTKWFSLPPFATTIDASSIGKRIAGRCFSSNNETTTALKWVLRCCPQLPRSLVQKLFRLRQVRREFADQSTASCAQVQVQQHRLRRVSAKEAMNSGDRIFLPITVEQLPPEKDDHHCNGQETNDVQSLELYKDSAIIVVNKPTGMPVQGGIGIKRSLDVLAAASLRYGYSEPPRLVHRLDRESSGILVLGRTRTGTSILHSIFREKTCRALSCNGIDNSKRILQKKYLALVIGTPKCLRGLISAPLAKVVMGNGKSERITIAHDNQAKSFQHAVTEYEVVKSSDHGLTWLVLSPLTGRKHQLRVHCAEVLGTPIVGDYKYGWHAHKKWKPISWSKSCKKNEKLLFGFDLESGSISEKQPNLHLHCRRMVLPNVAEAIEQLKSALPHDLSKLDKLNLLAPMPLHMQRSWDMLSS